MAAVAFGMYLMLMIGELGSYGSKLPDFMVFLGYEELPVHWRPFYNPVFAVAAALWVPGLVALIFGVLAFRSRIKVSKPTMITIQVTGDISVPGGHEVCVPPQQLLRKPSMAQ